MQLARTDFKMTDYSQKKKLVHALRTSNHQVKGPINIPYGVSDQIFKVIDQEYISVKQITPSLALEKTKTCFEKNPK